MPRPPKDQNLDPKNVQEIFEYRAAEGALYWRHRTRGHAAGVLAGCKRRDGYQEVRFGGKSYLLHRLIWCHVYGQMPIAYIDHIDGDKSNNRVENLRDVSHTVNVQNSEKPAGKLSAGVGKSYNKYFAQIQSNGERKYLGLFSTELEAAQAYQNARAVLHAEALSRPRIPQ